MTSEDRELLLGMLVVDEGVRLKPYTDTVGKLTIGVGRNLTDKGISAAESLVLLNNDIDEHWNELVKRLPWVEWMDPVRQIAVANLAFNLGVGGLLTFVNTLAAMKRGDWKAVASGLRNSKWYRQVSKARSERIIYMLQFGAWPPKVKP